MSLYTKLMSKAVCSCKKRRKSYANYNKMNSNHVQTHTHTHTHTHIYYIYIYIYRKCIYGNSVYNHDIVNQLNAMDNRDKWRERLWDIHTFIFIYMYIYIHIYTERGREREGAQEGERGSLDSF